MRTQEFTDEAEAHAILSRYQRARLLSVYFALRDNNVPEYHDSADSVLYLIPMKHYQSYFSLCVPRDELLDKILSLSV